MAQHGKSKAKSHVILDIVLDRSGVGSNNGISIAALCKASLQARLSTADKACIWITKVRCDENWVQVRSAWI